jgi:hypothetical protein
MPQMDKVERAAYDKAYREKNRPDREAKQAIWRSDNRDRIKAKDAKRRLQKRAQCLINAARTRSRAKGIEFSLDEFEPELQARIDAGKCELSGVEFDLSPGRKPNSPSLDRISPKLGYTPSNVRVICHALNAALGDWGEEALLPIMAGWIEQRNAINAEAACSFLKCLSQ